MTGQETDAQFRRRLMRKLLLPISLLYILVLSSLAIWAQEKLYPLSGQPTTSFESMSAQVSKKSGGLSSRLSPHFSGFGQTEYFRTYSVDGEPLSCMVTRWAPGIDPMIEEMPADVT